MLSPGSQTGPQRGSVTAQKAAGELMLTPVELEPVRAGDQDGAAMSSDVVDESLPDIAQVAREPQQRGNESVPPTAPGARWDARYRRRVVLVDAFVAVSAAVLGLTIRFGEGLSAQHLFLSLLLPPLWLIAVAVSHGYERRYFAVGTEEYRALVVAAVGLVALMSFVSFAAELNPPRSLVIVVFPTLLLASLAARRILRGRVYRRRKHGQSMQSTVVVGQVDSVRALVRQIQNTPTVGMRVAAACVSGMDGDSDGISEVEGVPVFGYPEEALFAVDLFDAEVVAVASYPGFAGKTLRRLGWSLEERNVDLVVSPGILEVAGPRLSIRPVAGMPLLHVERPLMSGVRRTIKRLVDLTLGIVMCLVSLPALFVIAVALHLDSPGPILFRQRRVGEQGEEFNMLKFRTMGVDAEARLAETVLAGDGACQMLFKMKVDPRVSRVGRLLRRYSLDELPQLVNVLRGEMSLVGPRPPLPREVAAYELDAMRRLRVRPGLSGLWQVSGRSDLSWDDSLRLDLWYVDNWSLVLDLQILSRTVRAVLQGNGAY